MKSTFTTLLHANVAQMRAGDKNACNELLSLVDCRLRHLARSMLSGFPKVERWSESDDVVQNASLRLLRVLETTAPVSSRHFMNLAALQIRRELIDLARSYSGPLGIGRHHDSVENLDEVARAGSTSHSAVDLLRWTELHEAVAKLEEPEREVFDLIFYHGRQQQEVAELCDVNVRTVRRRWNSALLQLKPALQDLIKS